MEELLAGRTKLTPADLENRRTHEANHDAAVLPDLLDAFRQARGVLICRLDAVDGAALAHTALHPRLRVPMSLVDHAAFVAEHYDYHLARITELLRL